MSALAMFGLKYPSLLQFDQDAQSVKTIKHNLRTLYNVEQAPSDTYMRQRLDPVDPREIRKAFTDIFSILQRGKRLENHVFLDNHYLMSIDGTGFFLPAKFIVKIVA